jgi:hypothetical protein
MDNVFKLSLQNVDETLKRFGVRHVTIESGDFSVREKIDEFGFDEDVKAELLSHKYTYLCELSWSTIYDYPYMEWPDDAIEYALVEFGHSLGEVIQNCLNEFIKDVQDGRAASIANHYGIYEELKNVSIPQRTGCPIKD